MYKPFDEVYILGANGQPLIDNKCYFLGYHRYVAGRYTDKYYCSLQEINNTEIVYKDYPVYNIVAAAVDRGYTFPYSLNSEVRNEQMDSTLFSRLIDELTNMPVS